MYGNSLKTRKKMQIIHRLMHYKVDDEDWREAELVFASKLVASMMYDRVYERLDTDRVMLTYWLDSILYGASPFSCWLFENFAHDQFLKGGQFPMRCLGGGDMVSNPVAGEELSPAVAEASSQVAGEASSFIEKALTIDARVGQYTRCKLKVPLETALQATSNMSASSTLQSVDSYILTDSELWMFQITRKFDKDQDLEGILSLLQYLNLVDKVKADPTFAKLVFVVSSDMRAQFRMQRITSHPTFGEMTETAVLAADCSMIPGIKQVKKRLRTAGDVLQAHNEGKFAISFDRSAVGTMSEYLASQQDAAYVEMIEQYVIGIDYRP